MKPTKITFLVFILLSIISSCTSNKATKYAFNHSNIVYSGRVEKVLDEAILIGSASSVTVYFTGDTCVLYLRNNNNIGLHNFYSIELDNEDLGRYIIQGDATAEIPVEITFEKEVHKIAVFKSTEASNGFINFEGILCDKIVTPVAKSKFNIEFIGNSITCGMGNDTLAIPCGTAEWYDQHNAYWAYGPTVSRALKANYVLSSVSGIGVYRNWNSAGPTMPEVYENLYLDKNNALKRDFTAFSPQIVSIALGTNDFSDGDGIKERLPFNAEHYTNNYIQFVETILKHYPNTQIALLSSPMVKGEKHKIFMDCLQKVKDHYEEMPYKSFAIFEFENLTPNGCDYHPDINDHMIMADQLYPFYKSFLEQ